MKKNVLVGGLFLLLAGCENLSDPMGHGLYVWENQSDHTVRIITLAGEYMCPPVLFDRLLSKGEKSVFELSGSIGGGAPLPLFLEFEGIEVIFDESITVPYTRKPDPGHYEPLSAPDDYPRTYDLILTDRYKKEIKEESYGYLNIWTYTFTNADYEAVKEWSEKQTE